MSSKISVFYQIKGLNKFKTPPVGVWGGALALYISACTGNPASSDF